MKTIQIREYGTFVVGKKNGITPEEFEEISGQPYEVSEE